MKKQDNQESIRQRVLAFIRETGLLSGRTRLLVAVSGGPDSVCMLHTLNCLREELGFDLHLAHLNHLLRGAESEEDARYVSRLAAGLGIPATIEARDVKAYKSRKDVSPEEAAREVRYAFLAEAAEAAAADCVAVGHTIDDNVETILLHLVRGAGTRGLGGLKAETVWKQAEKHLAVIRPLLTVTRKETAEYCRAEGLEPRIDSTNQLLAPLRNRIRHQLLPLLESYNPRIGDALLRTARIAADDLEALDIEIKTIKDEVLHRQADSIVFEKEKFVKLHPAWQRNLLRLAIEELAGSLEDIEAVHIEDMLGLLSKPAGKMLCLPGELVFLVEYGRFLLTKDAASLSPLPVLSAETLLQLPGETLLPGWRVRAEITGRLEIEKETDDYTAWLDYGKTGDRLSVRPRQSGDRFYPLGIGLPKKLGVFMIDAKIPRAWRSRVPVVCSPQQILWVVGWRIDDRVRVTEETTRVLRLVFERIDDNSVAGE